LNRNDYEQKVDEWCSERAVIRLMKTIERSERRSEEEEAAEEEEELRFVAKRADPAKKQQVRKVGLAFQHPIGLTN
jgi:hypothetical protein